MATEIRLNQSVTQNPDQLVGGDFGVVISSTLTGVNKIRAIVDGDLEVRGSVIGNLTGNVTGAVTGLAAASFANDAAAATGGIPVGGLYNTSGTVKVRLT